MIRLIATKEFGWMRWFALSIGLLFIPSVSANEELVWSGPGCVLLKNGNVLSASDIIPQGKQIAVRLDETGDVRIPSKDVVTIGRNKLELYYYQASKTLRWEAGEHWQLAKWCLRQGLVEQSHIHYEELKRLSGNHAKFKQLDSELKQALLQDPVMKAALNAAFPNESVSTASHTISIDRVASNTGSENSQHSQAKRGPPKATINLDRTAQDYFRLHIQPFLAMRCGQAGCHGAYGKSEFHVAKSGVLLGQPASEISLNSAARFIDHDNVESTKLWISATTAHGTQTTPSLTNNNSAERELLNRLRTWHQAVLRSNAVVTISPMVQVSQPSPALNATNTSMNRNPKEIPFKVNAKAEGFPPNPGPAMAVAPGSDVALPEIGDELLLLEKEIAKLEEKERTRKSSRRHDPEEFNRRFSSPVP